MELAIADGTHDPYIDTWATPEAEATYLKANVCRASPAEAGKNCPQYRKGVG